MVAYNFQSCFAPSVASYEKRQTIRAKRKRHVRPGEQFQAYTGMRTKSCRKLIPDPFCTSVDACCMDVHDETGETVVSVNGLGIDDYEAFAQADGFETFEAMDKFFHKLHGYPFEGVLIKW